MDDILIYSRDQTEHNTRLEAVFTRITQAGVTLNQERCEFKELSLTFLGHVIDATGIYPDPAESPYYSDRAKKVPRYG